MGEPVLLIASGDLRLSANAMCWPAQHAMEQQVMAAVRAEGFEIRRGHSLDEAAGHGFIASQKQGMEVFRSLSSTAPLIVAEAVWQYSHHVLHGLYTHRGPILTVANWSGQWPGLVGMLNLNGSLTKAGVEYSTLWSEQFTDDYFKLRLGQWLRAGKCAHRASHVRPFRQAKLDGPAAELGKKLAGQLRADK